MSAAEVIEQIKALPADQREEVVQFIHSFKEANPSSPGSELSREERFRRASDKVFAEHSELLRRLAE